MRKARRNRRSAVIESVEIRGSGTSWQSEDRARMVKPEFRQGQLLSRDPLGEIRERIPRVLSQRDANHRRPIVQVGASRRAEALV